jgi:uncharacterized protein (TIGR02145 family)
MTFLSDKMSFFNYLPHDMRPCPRLCPRWVYFLILFIPLHFSSPGQTISVSQDTTICLGGIASLSSTVVGGGYGTNSYTFEIYSYSPEPYSGGTPVLFGPGPPYNQDDRIAGPFNIGFSFCFFNTYYTQFYIGSNGWIGFSYNAAWTTFVAQQIPTTNNGCPKNCIMAPWQDWYPGWKSGGVLNDTSVFYYVTGTPPNRKLVVYWLDCPMYSCTSLKGTFQIVLNEQNSIIENHITQKPACLTWPNPPNQPNAATQGVHNSDGTIAFTATGRNNSSWTAQNESTRFVPDGISWYTGGFPGGTVVGYGTSINVSPPVTTTYTGVVATCGGGVSTDTVTVSVENPGFAYSPGHYCKDQPNPTPTVIQGGGSFSAVPAGLVFTDTLTGEINLAASSSGTYTITHTLTSPYTCTGTGTVIIYDLPASPVPNPSSVSRCGPGQVTMNVQAGLHQTAYWYDSPTGGIRYPFSGPVISTPVNTTTVFYAETYDSVTACTSASRTAITAIVKPIPAISNTLFTDTLCSEARTSLSFLSNPPGSAFAWTAFNSLGNVTGFTTPGTGNTINDLLTNHLYTTGIVTYSVIPTLQGCPGPVQNFLAVVKPKPDVYFSPLSDTTCSGQMTSLDILSHTAGTTFTWTSSGTAGISGYSGGAGSRIAQVLTSTIYVAGAVTYTSTPVAQGCVGLPGTVINKVFPTASVSFRTCNDTITVVNARPIILKGGLPYGGIYSGPGVNSLTGEFTPSVAGAGNHTIIYSYTNMFSCQTQASKTIHVFWPSSFVCGDTLIDIRDGKSYSTVVINLQCWMSANLNYGKYISSIQYQRDNCIPEKFCYSSNPVNCASSGGLYQWDEIMGYQSDEGSQGLCPPGWHVPSETDWYVLFDNFINYGFAGDPLKFSGYSGFNAYLKGAGFLNTRWTFVGFATFLWSSSSHGQYKAWSHALNSFDPSISYYPSYRSNAFAVRCLKD